MDGTKPFDTSLKGLIGLKPDVWAQFFAQLVGIPPGPSAEIDSTLSVTAQSDAVFRIDGPTPTLLHLEFESDHELGMPRRLLRYNVLIDHKHNLPVESVLVLLHRQARASDQTGVYRRVGARRNTIHEFHYYIERVWEQPVEYWLNNGVNLAPLSVLTDEAEANLETTMNRLKKCISDHQVSSAMRDQLYISTFGLSGLRFEPEQTAPLLRRLDMLLEDSPAYEWIRNQGREKDRRDVIIELGTERFGAPPAEIINQLKAITDLERLKAISKRVLNAASWDDLLQTPTQ